MNKCLNSKEIIMLCRVYPPHRGGVEMVAEQHAQFFFKSGYNVKIICMDPAQKTNYMQRVGKYNETIYSFKPTLKIQSVLLSFLYFFFSISQVIKSQRDAIIEIHHPSPLDSLILCISKIFVNRRSIIVFHANIYGKNKILEFISNIAINLSFKICKYVIFTSDNLRVNSELKYRIKEKSISISIANPYAKVTNMVRKNIQNKNIFKILFIGRLVPYKGLKYLIEALKGINNIELNIFGNGSEINILKKEIEKNSLEKKINFCAELSEENKKRMLENADCLVLPSINEAEAFGIVQLEALSHGLPVINTYLQTGVPEVSIHMISGLTVPPSDSLAIKLAIESLKNNEELYQQLSEGALSRAKEFASEKIYESFNRFVLNLEK